MTSERTPRADYHELFDAAGRPLAVLVIARLDDHPIGAELHVAADLPDAQVAAAQRQAEALLREQSDPAPPLEIVRRNLDEPTDAPAAAVKGDETSAAHPPREQRSAPHRLPAWLPILMIGLGILLAAWTFADIARGRDSQNAAREGVLSMTDPRTVNADEENALAAAAATVTPSPTPAPSPSPEMTPVREDSYCFWPGDTLSEVAYNADITLEELLAVNPGAEAKAGTTIRLPKGSTLPADWEAPRPQADALEDLPFGVSGYYLGRDNRTKRVALSFDVGFVEGNEERMAMLAERGIRGTFFVLGGAVENHPEMITQILDYGHELGNHSYTHDNFLWMTADEIQWELDFTEELTQAAYPGATTKPLFRAPFGAIDDEVIAVSNQAGYQIIGWTIDSRDWTEEINAEQLYDRVVAHICPGAIIAFHDVNEANGPALPRIIDYLAVNGYEFVTVSEILGE
ncbi:MAG: polysaccharide deacetylase family protein [Caldilineaceae bacterium]|nr:polysaccharide deacetylase family protein [Caldilineaceae bacterium]